MRALSNNVAYRLTVKEVRSWAAHHLTVPEVFANIQMWRDIAASAGVRSALLMPAVS